MKAIIIIYFCVPLLPSNIHGGSDECGNNGPRSSLQISDDDEQELNQAGAKVDEILTKGETIDRIFEPSKFIGRGLSCITYEGKLFRINRTVAMKFSPSWRNEIKLEFEMYSHLNAINNPSVEKYGIPAVYYYGKWKKYDMIAITLLDSQFHKIQEDYGFNFSIIDIFILCREYTRISKYMHSRGVCHGDSHLGNMMFRNNQGFIIDFDRASKVSNCLNRDCRKTDWGSFLRNMCALCGIDDDKITGINIVKTIRKIREEGLKTVLLGIAYYLYNYDPVDYDALHQMITEKILGQGVQEPATVSWLTDEQKRETLAEWAGYPSPDIRSIRDPYTMEPFCYPEPNYDYFVNEIIDAE